jgi:hypothetical protein
LTATSAPRSAPFSMGMAGDAARPDHQSRERALSLESPIVKF